MNFLLIANILGMWMLLYCGALLPPLIVSLIYNDGEATHLSLSLLLNLLIGIIIWLRTEKRKVKLRTRDGFIIVLILWLVTSIFGAVPFAIALEMSPVDAIFESVSAFTTTGATVISGLDQLPKSILFFRQEMQWLGGIGVVVSAITLLPMLGIGGMQMFKAETPGPIKDEKLTPRILNTAHVMWRLYLVMTVACAVLYWFGGMSVFDAIAHSFSTLSTGGFSTHDASLGYFNSVFIEMVAVVFMLLGGINFGVHFLVWKRLSFRPYFSNLEVRTFLILVAVITLLVGWVLYSGRVKVGFPESLRYAVFTVVSIITSTGFGIDNFSLWPSFLPLLLIFISFIGGCSGSTAGGIKVIRFIIMGKGVGLELQQLLHPRLVMSLKVQNKVVAPRTVDAVRGYFSVYVATFILLLLLLLGEGMDLVTAFSAIATCMNNLGPGLGEVAANFKSVTEPTKWILSFAMLLGRLEMFTLLVVLSPSFWRH